MKKNVRDIAIIGRRWFQKSYGNTYHTVQVLVNGVEVFQSPKSYGYGEHYLQTARDWLVSNGVIGECNHMRIYCEDEGRNIAYSASVHDVRRERDL